MGVSLFLEMIPYQSIPLDFTTSDGKDIAYFLSDDHTLECLESHFRLDLAPLSKVADEGTSVESWIEAGCSEEEVQSLVADRERENEAAWQNPDELIAALKQLIAAWNLSTTKLPDDLFASGADDYFTGDGFVHDLTDLQRMAVWAKEHGAERIRLFVG